MCSGGQSPSEQVLTGMEVPSVNVVGREVLCDLSYNAIMCSHGDLPVNRQTELKMLPSHKICAGGNKHLVIRIVTGAFSLSAFCHLNVPLHHLPPSFPHQLAEHNLQDIQW